VCYHVVLLQFRTCRAGDRCSLEPGRYESDKPLAARLDADSSLRPSNASASRPSQLIHTITRIRTNQLTLCAESAETATRRSTDNSKSSRILKIDIASKQKEMPSVNVFWRLSRIKSTYKTYVHFQLNKTW